MYDFGSNGSIKGRASGRYDIHSGQHLTQARSIWASKEESTLYVVLMISESQTAWIRMRRRVTLSLNRSQAGSHSDNIFTNLKPNENTLNTGADEK